MRYKEIKTYAVNVSIDGIDPNYKEINSLIKENLSQGTLPFFSEKPLPPDMNVITGRATPDINSEKILLKASSIGAASTMWIYGADAEYLGFELKSSNPTEFREAVKKNPDFNCRPIVIQKVRERFSDREMRNKTNVLSESLCRDAQCAYLLDQFTEKSVEKVFNLRRLEAKLDGRQSMKSSLARKIIENRIEYNTGKKSGEHTKAAKANLIANMKRNSPVFKEIINKRNADFKNYLPEQKTIYDFCYKRFLERESGERLYAFSDSDRERIETSFATLLEKIEENPKISGIIARTIFDAYAFSQRLTHRNFSLEPIFTKEDELNRKNNTNRRMPDALTRQETVRSIIDKDTREKYKSRSFSMHVGEEIGM